MLFHFEFRCQGRWEAIGSGDAGQEGSTAALEDLLALAGDSLPAGTYRCIAATSAATGWDHLRLDADGTVGAVEDPVMRAAR